jgi:hypothetical protein
LLSITTDYFGKPTLNGHHPKMIIVSLQFLNTVKTGIQYGKYKYSK